MIANYQSLNQFAASGDKVLSGPVEVYHPNNISCTLNVSSYLFSSSNQNAQYLFKLYKLDNNKSSLVKISSMHKVPLTANKSFAISAYWQYLNAGLYKAKLFIKNDNGSVQSSLESKKSITLIDCYPNGPRLP